MDLSSATFKLAALAQDTRLRAFRMLIEHGSAGLPATVIAGRLGIRNNLMSSHLATLAGAGLTTVRRDGRRIIHAVNIDAVSALMTYLVQDCCRVDADTCALVTNEISPETKRRIPAKRSASGAKVTGPGTARKPARR